MGAVSKTPVGCCCWLLLVVVVVVAVVVVVVKCYTLYMYIFLFYSFFGQV